MRKKTSLLAIGLILSTLLTGCSQEDIINSSSKLIADLITTTLETEKDPVEMYEEHELEEDEPEIIEQYIKEKGDSWQNEVYSYYYNQLTPEQQAIYNRLYETVLNMKENTTLNLGSLKQEDISTIFRALHYDNPDIYWIQAYKYIVDENNMYFYPTYLVSPEEKSLYDNMLDEWTEKIIERVDKNWGEYEKELTIYNYIIENTEYSLDAPLNQSLISVVQGESVCLGYTKAMKYLCDRIGLECIVVEGTSKEGINHSWNKIKINNNWYNVDSTNSNTAQIFSDNYDMFNITDKLINNRYTERQISCDCGRINFLYPVADNIKEDYYNRKGLYIERLEEIENMVINYFNEGTITIRLGEQCEIEKIQEYMKDLKIRANDNNQGDKKCTSFVIMEYIRLLQINWE